MKQLALSDAEQLDKMIIRYGEFSHKLLDPELPHHEKQSINIALLMLKELITNKLRDVKRPYRGKGHYE